MIAAARSISAQPRPGVSTIIKCGNPAKIYKHPRAPHKRLHTDYGLFLPLGKGVNLKFSPESKNIIWDTIGKLKILHSPQDHGKSWKITEHQPELPNYHLYTQYVMFCPLPAVSIQSLSCTFFVHLVIHHLSGESPGFGGRGKLRQGAKQGLRASG